jgi:hypothetical protein
VGQCSELSPDGSVGWHHERANIVKGVGRASADLGVISQPPQQREGLRPDHSEPARDMAEEQGVTPDEAALVAAHLAAFMADDPRPPVQSFAALLDAHGRRDIATTLRRWDVDVAARR